VNLLGKFEGKQILDVTGHAVHRDDGELRLVTIRTSRPEDRVGLFRAIQGWANPEVDVYPYDGIYAPDDTNESTKEQSAQQMTSSQDAATAAALTELGIDYDTRVAIADVAEGGPSDGTLRTGDVILSAAGQSADSLVDVVETIKAKEPGSQVEVVVRRGERQLTRTLTTAPVGESGEEAKQSRIGVSIQQTFDFPFDVKVTLDEAIGGPSAGMMFALSIIDVLTPGSMTGGRVIAGTGEISPEGQIGSIGGVQQKIIGAQHDEARLFLVPAENCAEAVEADYDPEKIRLARVATLEDAVDVIQTWVANPDAPLPACTSTGVKAIE
jgi:PDZ domain-containing protein